MTDIHINPGYYPNITADTFCEMKPTGVNYTEELAYMGRQGCDPPIELLERILIKLSAEPNLHILYMPGDFIGHGIPIDGNDTFD